LPFFQKQLRKWQGEIKIFQKRGIFFCTYNQQSHRKEYLKESKKTYLLTKKYNSDYQKETGKTKNQENFSNLSFFFSSLVLVEKSFSLISYLHKSLFLTYFQKQGKLLSFFSEKHPP
jgi:hypothetical protein